MPKRLGYETTACMMLIRREINKYMIQEKINKSKLVNDLVKRIRDPKEKPRAKIITISTKIPSFFKKFGFKTIQKQYDKDYDLMALEV